ncbi:MAG: molybdate ABC transporter substrate-binding protein [Firmicutes bacterium]|nr:molybdate ABC transporter substrate-binding protein [Bacillota bacterium]
MNRKQTLRLTTSLVIAVFMIMSLIGCSAPVQDADSEISGQTQDAEQEISEQAEPVTLNLSVAASLTDAMQEIQEIYKDKQPHVTIEYNFGSSGSLQQQIEQGAPTDIFVSAASKQMNELQEKGLLLDDSRIDLLQNELVLVVPLGFTGVADFADLAKDDITLVSIGDPESVPAGKYAQEALKTLGIWEQVEPKIVLAKDVRQVLAYVETEEVQVGAVYRTDAGISDKVEIVAAAPEGSHSPVIYPAAVVKDSPQPDEAKVLLDFLTGEEAKTVLEKYGFRMLN